jgi:hypothetical protein
MAFRVLGRAVIIASVGTGFVPHLALAGKGRWVVDRDRVQCAKADFTSIQRRLTRRRRVT